MFSDTQYEILTTQNVSISNKLYIDSSDLFINLQEHTCNVPCTTYYHTIFL